MATRLVDLESGQTWILAAHSKHRAGDWSGSPWWRYRINHGPRADVQLCKPWVSKHHGGVDFRDHKWWAKDGGSINTVTVNGERIDSPHDRELRDGDVLGFGETRLRFETDGGPPTAE